MATKDLYLYTQSGEQLLRLNLSKLHDGDCQLEVLVNDFSNEYPIGMGLMSVNSKLYMFGGAIGFSNVGETFCLGAYLVDPTNEKGPLVYDGFFPKFIGSKMFPIVVTIEGKTYVINHPWWSPPEQRLEVFDHSTLNWKFLEDSPLFYRPSGLGQLGYSAWGHKILIQNEAGFSIFDTKKELWEEGDSFVERWRNVAPLPIGTAAEIEEGLYIGMSEKTDAVVAYECDPDDGLLRSHQVLGDFSDLISREIIPRYGRGFVAPIGDGRFCFLLSGTTFGEYVARLATFQVSPSVPGRLPVHLQCLECFDVKGDRELDIDSILVMPDWSKKRAVDSTESDALFDEVIINGAETGDLFDF